MVYAKFINIIQTTPLVVLRQAQEPQSLQISPYQNFLVFHIQSLTKIKILYF